MGKVWGNPAGQLFVTIPKALVDSMGWHKGDGITWEIMGRNKLKLEKMKI